MKFTEEKLTYLLFLHKQQKANMSVTSMANRLGISKSSLSKVLSTFYQEKMLKEKGKCMLSVEGYSIAGQWASDIQKISEWLVIHASLPGEEAKEEALKLSLHLKETTKKRMIQDRKLGCLFHILENVKKIHGEMLSANLEDGEYPVLIQSM